jgi:hypothetical protein
VCAAGRYASGTGNTQCSVCPAGSETDTLASAGASQCNACIVGQYSASSTAACQACILAGYGTTSTPPNGTGASSCDICVPGNFDEVAPAQTGQICASCRAGYETDTRTGAGGTTCTICTAATFSVNSTVGCQHCPVRHSSGGSSCSAQQSTCNADTTCYTLFQGVQTSGGSSAPVSDCLANPLCAAYHTCMGGSVTDTLASPGASNCTSCPVGFMTHYSTIACYRVTCAAGSWCDTVGQAHDCPGTGNELFAAPNQGVCNLCTHGWYQSPHNDSCLQCAVGQFSDTNATQCELVRISFSFAMLPVLFYFFHS